jgi:hypothetical protein
MPAARVRTKLTGDDVEAIYAHIDALLVNLRAEMRTTWNRFSHESAWEPALSHLERIRMAVRSAHGIRDANDATND